MGQIQRALLEVQMFALPGQALHQAKITVCLFRLPERYAQLFDVLHLVTYLCDGWLLLRKTS